MNNLTTLANTTDDLYSYVNIGKYTTLGLKTNFKLTFDKLNFQSSISYIGRQNNVNSSEEVGAFSYAMEWSSNLTYNIQPLNSEVSIFYKNTGALPSFYINSEGEIQESIIDGYQIMDFTYSWTSPEEKVTCMLGCKNAFNIQNVNTVSGAPGIHQSGSGSMSVGYGRSFFTSLKWYLR